MKKFTIIFVSVFVGAFLISCSEVGNDAKVDEIQEPYGGSIWIDPETGVNYVAFYQGGVCVRVDADNQPIVGDAAKAEKIQEPYGGSIWIDPETGVNYVAFYQGGACVRVDADNQPIVTKGCYFKQTKGTFCPF